MLHVYNADLTWPHFFLDLCCHLLNGLSLFRVSHCHLVDCLIRSCKALFFVCNALLPHQDQILSLGDWLKVLLNRFLLRDQLAFLRSDLPPMAFDKLFLLLDSLVFLLDQPGLVWELILFLTNRIDMLDEGLLNRPDLLKLSWCG